MTDRRATVDDAAAFGALIAGGFASYRAFQPAGWEPPGAGQETTRSADRLAQPATWARLALEDGVPAGCVLFEPAGDLEGVAHLAYLFVAPGWWGTGVGLRLHALAVAAMRERGHHQGRLFTPERHARARRFYEREGWRPAGPECWEDQLAMSLVEYRLGLRDG